MALPPPGPRYRRYWEYYNRPLAGCGCLYSLFALVLIWFVLSWLFTPLRFGYW